jgi:serine/threonine protein kinase
MEAATSERHGAAVLIGIGAYLQAEQVWPLRYAARDAEAMAGVLSDPEVCGFPVHKVKLLTDQSASRDAVAHHLSKWLPEQARGAEIAVIYFAGHGMIHRIGQRDEGFLLPYDADPDDVVTRGILMTDLARWIDAIDAGTIIVCLDCCHAAKLIPRGVSSAESLGRDMRIRPAILQALTGRGRYLIASCDDDQVSLEAETWGHGLFTYHLLDGLQGAGDRDGDGRIGVAELFEHVAEAVERDARAMGTIQKPWSCSIGAGGAYLSAPRGGFGITRPKNVRNLAVVTAERLWREQGAPAAVSEIERTIDWDDVGQLVSVLDLLRVMEHTAIIPFLFRCLAHAREDVRARAKKIVGTIGWGKVAAFIEVLALHCDPEMFGAVLDGLAVFEAHDEIVTLLDRLVTLLKGDQRKRTIVLLERNQQALDLERIAELFRESHSPYQIQKALGQGLCTAAYLARDESSDLDVVVRVLRAELVSSPQIRAQFLDLSRRSVRLVHQNLVLTREVRAYPDRHIYFVVRDYVDGVTLQKLLESGRVFSPDQILKIIGQLVRSLTPLHTNRITHGSIKPSNIFLCVEDRVILGDQALPLRGFNVQLDRLSYDYRYAPPEMFSQDGTLGPWSDLYALGCVAYELACGAPPFVSDNPFELGARHVREAAVPPSQRSSSLGPVGDAFLLRLLAKSPSDRFQSLDEALQAVDDLHTALFPRVKLKAPSAPILRESSLIRYATDVALSLVSFPEDLRSADDTDPTVVLPTGAAFTEDTPTTGIAPDLDSSFDVAERDPSKIGRCVFIEEMSATWRRRSARTTSKIGRYVIREEIGRGGFHRTYLALDQVHQRKVAIKVSHETFRSDPDRWAHFERQAMLTTRLSHPNVVSIHDVVEENGSFYTVLEYVGGGNLSQRLQERVWAPDEAARLVATLARAVDYVHSLRVVHRNLKPSKILFEKDGTPKISYFGLAKLIGEKQENGAEMEGTIAGTLGYMSPEQARGEVGRIGPGTDIHALGAILYELLAGRRPFEGGTPMEMLRQVQEYQSEPPSRWRPGSPRELDAICLKCLEKQTEHRYSTAADLADDLERFLAGKAIPARPPGEWDRLRLPFLSEESPEGQAHPDK